MTETRTPGRYQGTIMGATLDQVGENKTPLVKILFNVKDFGQCSWSGWFTDKVMTKTGLTVSETTVNQLVTLGFTGDSLADLMSKDIKTLFNCEKVWNLDIDFQTDKNGMPTKYFTVNWINDPEKGMGSSLSEAEARQVFAPFQGMLVQQRAAMPKPSTPKMPESKPVSNDNISSDDIPF